MNNGIYLLCCTNNNTATIIAGFYTTPAPRSLRRDFLQRRLSIMVATPASLPPRVVANRELSPAAFANCSANFPTARWQSRRQFVA
jgi:hypothetical protein